MLLPATAQLPGRAQEPAPACHPPAPLGHCPNSAPSYALLCLLCCAGTLKGNWDAFWAAVQRDHSNAALIWNEACRAELREALQAEEASLRLARLRGAGGAGAGASSAGGDDHSGALCWNHAEFRVAYPSLRWVGEVCLACLPACVCSSCQPLQ
jgi:hypothetical protein